jgi:hypothetical protein
MDKDLKLTLWVFGISVVVFGTIKWAQKMHVSPKERAILDIEAAKYRGFEEDFLIAWGEAKKQNQPEFMYNDKLFVTSTGRSKK